MIDIGRREPVQWMDDSVLIIDHFQARENVGQRCHAALYFDILFQAKLLVWAWQNLP